MAADPLALRRDGFDEADAVAVKTAAGVVLWIEPARVTPLEILAGRPSAYAEAAYALRDQWVRAGLAGGDGQPDWKLLGRVVTLAVGHSHPEATAEDLDAWIGKADGAAVVEVARVACGLVPTPRARLRKRAVALALAGLGSAPLTANESAPLDDWTRNTGKAPIMIGGG